MLMRYGHLSVHNTHYEPKIIIRPSERYNSYRHNRTRTHVLELFAQPRYQLGQIFLGITSFTLCILCMSFVPKNRFDQATKAIYDTKTNVSQHYAGQSQLMDMFN